ncbi:MAG: glycosyltransferase family 2 protein, partial [Dysgonamonadaceae bacterium]|nr:glycosyltransferase family 2 protein [Dysgonamonadaceae bacterium]
MKQNPVFLTTSISQQYDNQPLVSVLIPACNSARYIGKAIDSILAQNYPNIEIIVVDDGSTDETGSVIAAAKAAMPTKQGISGQAGNDEIVRYFYKEHSGISATRNFALEKANGEYIAWCDADDYWMAGKLAVQMQYFAENPDCQIVFTRYKNFIDNEELINTPKVTNELESEKTLKFLISTSLCRKRIFECLGSFREDLQCSEDTE